MTKADVNGAISSNRTSRLHSVLPRLLLLIIAAFAVVHTPPGTSDQSRSLQPVAERPLSNVRSADLPKNYSIREHGRGGAAIVQGLRPVQKALTEDGVQKSAIGSSSAIIGIPAKTVAERVHPRPRHAGHQPTGFSARAPPAIV